MIHVPNRLQLSVVAVVAVLTAAVLMSLDQDLGAVAAVVAVGCIAEARRHDA